MAITRRERLGHGTPMARLEGEPPALEAHRPAAASRTASAPIATAPSSSAQSSAPAAGAVPVANRPQRSVTDLFEVRTAMFEVPPAEADRVENAARELAAYVQAHEPRTRFFGVLRDQDCRGRFLYTAVFDNQEAELAHHGTAPARQFVAALLTSGVRLESRRWSAVAGV